MKPRGVIFKNKKLEIPKLWFKLLKNTNRVIQLKPGSTQVFVPEKHKSQ